MLAWLKGLHMSQYEETMVEAGYDDLDFVCEIALDDLHDIGITKRGNITSFVSVCVCNFNVIRSREAFTSGYWRVD